MLPDLYANEEADSEVRGPARLKGTSPLQSLGSEPKVDLGDRGCS